MKRKGSTQKVLSIAKQKVKSAVQQVKQKVRAQRAVNLYERLIGIQPTKKVVVSPMKIRRSVRKSIGSLRKSIPEVVAIEQKVVRSPMITRKTRRSTSRSRSPKKM